MEVRGEPAYMRAACEGSLKWLGVDCIMPLQLRDKK
jgi:aryl-alcohol dehydrogenase-like predicted oxidoreductase